jgi:hypothetical protein
MRAVSAGLAGLALILSLSIRAAQKPKPPVPLRPVGERSVTIPGSAVAVFALNGQWGVLTSAPPALLLVSPTGETVKTISLGEFEGRNAVSDGEKIYLLAGERLREITSAGEHEVPSVGKHRALILGPGRKPWVFSGDQPSDATLSMREQLILQAQSWTGQGDDLWLISEKGWTRAKDGKNLSPPPPGELKAALGDLLLVAKDGKFRPFSLQKNDFIWSRKLPSPIREALALGGAIYMASEDGLLHRFTESTGFENATFDLQQRGPLLKAEWADKLMIAPLEGRTVTALSAEAKPERLILLALHQRIMGMAASGERLALLVQGRDDKFTLELYHR